MREKKIENVKPVLGDEADPKLAPGSCDLMVMVDVYHEFDFPYEMMRKMVSALKPSGRIVFVEYRAEDPAIPIKLVHKMSEAQVRKEMALQPEMEWIETRKELPQQHIIVSRRK
jgi:SAM-dependent methyltransferase